MGEFKRGDQVRLKTNRNPFDLLFDRYDEHDPSMVWCGKLNDKTGEMDPVCYRVDFLELVPKAPAPRVKMPDPPIKLWGRK